MNPNVNLSILTGFITPQPFVTLAPDEETDNIANDIITTKLELTDVINKSAAMEFRPRDSTNEHLGQFRTPTSTNLPVPDARVSSVSTTSPTNKITMPMTQKIINDTTKTPSTVNGASKLNSTRLTSAASPITTTATTGTNVAETTTATITTTTTTTTTRIVKAPASSDEVATVTAATTTATAVPTAATAVTTTLPSTLSSTSSSMKYGNTVRRPTAAKSIIRSNNSRSKLKTKNTGKLSTTVRPGKSVGNMTAQSMSLTMNSLADLDHPEKLNLEFQAGKLKSNLELFSLSLICRNFPSCISIS